MKAMERMEKWFSRGYGQPLFPEDESRSHFPEIIDRSVDLHGVVKHGFFLMDKGRQSGNGVEVRERQNGGGDLQSYERRR